MRVLQICHKIPFPPNDGGTLATYQHTKAMIEMGWSVKMLSLSTTKHPFVEMPVDPIYNSTAPEHVAVDTTPKISELVKGIWSKNNYIVSRFNSPEFAKLIADNLAKNEYDLIVFEGTFTAVYVDMVRKKSKAILMMRSHNVEYQLWEDRLFAEPSAFKRFVLGFSVNQLKDFELTKLKKFDVIATISMNDKAYFNSYFGLQKTIYVPFGISLPEDTIVEDQDAENKLVFLGALDWEPNIVGLNWFVNEVWPLIRERNSKLEFHIAGRNAKPDFGENLPEGVFFEGEIDDAHSFILTGKLMVVPLFEASGIRIKIIEGLALGQVIATTTKALEGIPAQNGKDIIIGDTPRQMARVIVDVLKYKDQHQSISRHSRILAEKEFDITNTQKALLKMINTFKK